MFLSLALHFIKKNHFNVDIMITIGNSTLYPQEELYTNADWYFVIIIISLYDMKASNRKVVHTDNL